jgi:hypothetical protein
MNWQASVTIVAMWLGAGIGAHGSPATGGGPIYFICAAVCTYFILVRLAGTEKEKG